MNEGRTYDDAHASWQGLGPKEPVEQERAHLRSCMMIWPKVTKSRVRAWPRWRVGSMAKARVSETRGEEDMGLKVRARGKPEGTSGAMLEEFTHREEMDQSGATPMSLTGGIGAWVDHLTRREGWWGMRRVTTTRARRSEPRPRCKCGGRTNYVVDCAGQPGGMTGAPQWRRTRLRGWHEEVWSSMASPKQLLPEVWEE